MKRLHSICTAAAVLLMTVSAHAAIVPVWSSNATSCAADAQAVKFDRYVTAAGRVAHRGGNVDLILLACEISDPTAFSGSEWKLLVTYRDSTGTAKSAAVTARLERVSRLTGVQSTVATLSSDTSAVTAVNQNEIGFTHTFEFDDFYYYALLSLDRSASSEIVQIIGVSIEKIIL